MKKRLLCLAFTLLMVLSFTPAFGVVANAAGTNLIASFGSFNKESDLNYLYISGINLSYDTTGGATGSGGAAKIEVTRNYGSALVYVPMVVGEVYDITFYAKAEKEAALKHIPFMGENW